ncbi:MAG: YeeE/YedE thiosulfate transporter family protein [Gammaproteobacteria bacterium]|nr:YeeE/YedE thiosulfate transporter family protein [Gammaproteobacteria bacterium]MDH3559540.1 YeeE/YedE thiosulfate transporter family protein [Gammaproteobacteria bacterium]
MDQASVPQGVFSRLAAAGWLSGLREDYEQIFVKRWSPYLGAILLVVVISALMASGLFWGIYGGLKLWGNWFNNFIGLGPLLGINSELQSPLLNRISLMDITLVIGAFCAALLAGQFRINRPPPLEFITGALGGSLMGIGASLAGGCTTGGFFTPLIFASPAGWAMWAGLLGGAFLGLKALLWVMEHITWGTAAAGAVSVAPLKRFYPLFGLAVLLLIAWWATHWFSSDNQQLASRGIIIIAGFALGFILHRSRFCFARVFREPFMTGEGTMTKAMILALALGIPVSSLLLQQETLDPYLAIPATFWLGSVVGGVVFGIGMVFAGGCASGSLWRMGEGHLKLWVAVFFFAWIGSVFSAIVKRWDLLTREMSLDLVEVSKVGKQVFLPDVLPGWGWTYLLSFAILGVWYLLVRYNESTNKFTVL